MSRPTPAPAADANPAPSGWHRAELWAVLLVLLGCTLWRHGWPSNPTTAFALLAAVVPAWAAARFAQRRLRLYTALWAVGFTVVFHLPWMATPRMDVQGGRQGVLIAPFGLSFAHDGVNTALVRSLIGKQPAVWAVVREAQVDAQGLIFDPRLADLLETLPGEFARTKVVSSLADAHNLLRHHQALLLACFAAYGPPAGGSAEQWWQANGWYFEAVSDADQAAGRALGLTWMVGMLADRQPPLAVRDAAAAAIRARLHVVASDMEQGVNGGSTALQQAMARLFLTGAAKGQPRDGQLWWWQPPPQKAAPPPATP